MRGMENSLLIKGSVERNHRTDNEAHVRPESAYVEFTKLRQTALTLINNDETMIITNDSRSLSKYTNNVQKECLPGRDDSNGEINPTSHRQRECLRYVQKNSKPRIGIMVTPGFITNALGNWIKSALERVSQTSENDIEVLLTHHVPVYGYGKSHGFSKLIRITLPLPLAVVDGYMYENLRQSSDEGIVEELTKSKVKEVLRPSQYVIESILKLIMRWNCRLSHVSAHTSMISVQISEVLEDPLAMLRRVVQFVFANNWEWGNGKDDEWKEVDSIQEAASYLEFEITTESNLSLVMKDVFIIHEEIRNLLHTGSNMTSDVESAFKQEMKFSEDMTHWPCPSFWIGVEKLKMNSDLVPDCRANHPWIQCNINRDKCEVKQDTKCN